MSRIRIVGGTIVKTTGGDHNIYSDGNIVYNSAKAITETSDVGISYGEPLSPPKKEIIESSYKFESTYVHDHLLNVAKEMMPKFNADDTSIICKFYKAVNDGKITNLPIEVSKNLHSRSVFYDLEEKKIIIWETSLLGVEKNDDQKIKLLQALTQSYSAYLKECLKDISSGDNFESYDYDLFRFDAIGTETVVIGKLETPAYKGNLDLSFVEVENKAPEKYDWKPEKDSRAHGPNAGNGGDGGGFYGGPDDPPTKSPNIGFKFSYSLKGGFTASVYVGISKRVSSGNFGAMGSLNTALTFYGKGAIGTSSMSPTLVTLSATPSITLGYKTGNALQMNLFNQHAVSGVYNPYEYAFTLGTTGILSSGSVSREFNPETGQLGINPYNSNESHTRNQIVGGAAIKIGDFMIASYNDIYKPPLFFGMGSDQYFSAGVNMQAKLPRGINAAYAVDMYYGKSNNKNTYNQDKIINGQNYDYQQLFDVLLNSGQETFSITDVNGNLTTKTKFGYGTFWPTNAMHDSIAFPETPKEPKKPERSNYNNDTTFNESVIQYQTDLAKYKKDKINYNVSTQLKSSPTFHHLYVVYNEENKKDLDRLNTYIDAGQSDKGKLLKEFYELDEKNKNNDKTNK
jgi:hypothetical protein